MKTTRPFNTYGPFMIYAESTMSMSVTVQSTTSEYDVYVLSSDGSVPAESYIPKGGKYLLDVMAFSPWKVTVTRSD